MNHEENPETTPTPAVKVQRTRTRAYEAPVEDGPAPAQDHAEADGNSAGPGWGPAPPRPLPQEQAKMHAAAMALVRRYTTGAAGVGLIPIPLLDTASMSALQYIMVKKLANLYGVKFEGQRLRAFLAGFISGLGAVGVAGGLSLSLFKFLPLVGPPLTAASLPAMTGAFTYAVGRVFVLHFETGGTLLDFDPQAMAEHFQKGLAEGRKILSRK